MGSLNRFGRQLLAAAVVLGGVTIGQLATALPAAAITPDDCGIFGNLVANCGFESGMLDGGWTGSGVTVDGSDVHSGSDAANLNGATTATLSQNISGTTAGEQYDLTVWVTTTTERDTFTAEVDNVVGTTQAFSILAQPFDDSIAYEVLDVPFTATMTAPTIKFTDQNSGSGGGYHVDDVAVAPSSCSDVPGNLVHNCGFETGTIDPTTDWTFGGADGGLDFSSPVHSGSHVFNWHFAAQGETLSQTLSGTHDGDTYELVFWFRGQGSGPDRFTAQVDNVQGGGNATAADLQPPNNGYQRFESRFTAGSTPPTLTFTGIDNNGPYFLDDVSVRQLTTTVTFDAQGGSATDSQTVDLGDSATQPTDPSKAGFTFKGWYTSPDGLGSLWDFSDPVNSDLTLYADYSQTASACDAVAHNLVKNCGFETGTLADWNFTPASSGGHADVNDSGDPSHSGLYQFSFGATHDDDTLYQPITGTTNGSEYRLVFWLAEPTSNTGDEGGAGPDFSATVQDVAGGTVTALSGHDPDPFGYTRYEATFTATGADPTVYFAGANPSHWFDLDDISVVAVPAGISPPPPPTITVTSSKSPSSSGDAVTYTATLSPPPGCGSVSWLIDNAAPPSGTATGGSGGSFTLGPISSLSVGTHPVTAVYSGCAAAGTGSGTVIQEVDKPPASPPPTGVVDPTITAKVKSTTPKQHGWWSNATVISFNCTVGSAPLTHGCPGPVTLTKSGADQSVTGSVTATDGGRASVTVIVNIDRVAPTLHVKRDGRRLSCHATDGLSGVQSCTIHRHKHTHHGVTTVRWTATATDSAGNVSTGRGYFNYHNRQS